jgi:predicted RNA-binding Zn-ribbon protein involved in translation (DUF1610 family)
MECRSSQDKTAHCRAADASSDDRIADELLNRPAVPLNLRARTYREYGSWTARTSSGSRASAAAVKSTKSANRTLTTFRSSRLTCSGASDEPQASQNLASARFSCPHCGHRLIQRVLDPSASTARRCGGDGLSRTKPRGIPPLSPNSMFGGRGRAGAAAGAPRLLLRGIALVRVLAHFRTFHRRINLGIIWLHSANTAAFNVLEIDQHRPHTDRRDSDDDMQPPSIVEVCSDDESDHRRPAVLPNVIGFATLSAHP